ncbi:MAG TPA: ElyC/SanA/YdcF family protein [Chitinispirillaceae bacterium]|nr:ElyC/SanA/YdcF family protein [Chitinispirillaceae bacterium]
MLKKVSIILLSGIVLFLGGTIVFKNIANWLIVSDSVPQNLNIVFTFAGEGVRVDYSRSLMQKYPEATWVLSDYENGYARLLRKNKFNMDRVVVIDTCKNTKSEVNALAQWVDQIKPASDSGSTISIGLVSSPYHMRRIKMMINRRFKDKNIKFHYLPVPLKQYKWTSEMVQNWWKTSEVSKVVFIELQKIVYYFLIL